MREHEVPTHVQAEDRVLLGFTFPQIVAITAVCALSYGAYRYAPVGPSEVRMALAVVFGLVGVAMVVGKIGGRRLPLVVADLLKFNLGARRYAGPVSQLVRTEAPAPPQPVRGGPGPLRLMAKSDETRPGQAQEQEEAPGEGEGAPQQPQALPSPRLVRQAQPGKDGKEPAGPRPPGRDAGERGGGSPAGAFLAVMAAVLMAAAVALSPGRPGRRPRAAGRTRSTSSSTPPVEGRRIFVEGLSPSPATAPP